MKRLGQLLIAIGFLEGALVSVLDETAVPWSYLALGLALGVVGVILINVAERRTAREIRETGAGITEIEAALGQVVQAAMSLDAEKDEIHPYDVRLEIDRRFPVPISEFVEARDAIAHVYGLQAYADVMSHFAAGERYLNRVWSCSADGYVDEIKAYLPRVHEEFNEALQMLHGFRAQA